MQYRAASRNSGLTACRPLTGHQVLALPAGPREAGRPSRGAQGDPCLLHRLPSTKLEAAVSLSRERWESRADRPDRVLPTTLRSRPPAECRKTESSDDLPPGHLVAGEAGSTATPTPTATKGVAPARGAPRSALLLETMYIVAGPVVSFRCVPPRPAAWREAGESDYPQQEV